MRVHGALLRSSPAQSSPKNGVAPSPRMPGQQGTLVARSAGMPWVQQAGSKLVARSAAQETGAASSVAVGEVRRVPRRAIGGEVRRLPAGP